MFEPEPTTPKPYPFPPLTPPTPEQIEDQEARRALIIAMSYPRLHLDRADPDPDE